MLVTWAFQEIHFKRGARERILIFSATLNLRGVCITLNCGRGKGSGHGSNAIDSHCSYEDLTEIFLHKCLLHLLTALRKIFRVFFQKKNHQFMLFC